MNTFLIIFFILIAILFGMTIHELGHFIFAKIFKVNVKEFSIGIGPKIFQWQTKSGMKISLRWIPLMAYVLIDSSKVIGLYSEILNEHLSEEEDINEKVANENLSFIKRKYFLFKYKRFYKSLDNYKYLSSKSDKYFLLDKISLWKRIFILFGGVLFNLLSFFVFWMIVYFAYDDKKFNPFEQLGQSFLVMLKNMVFLNDQAGSIFGSIGEIINGSGTGGAGDFTKLPIFEVFKLITSIFTLFGIVLFVYNLLPIPPLDGYKIIVECLETWFKFKVSKKTETIVTFIGFGLLLYIFVTAIVADIRSSFNGNKTPSSLSYLGL